MNEISIITPVYNEENNIIPFLESIVQVMNKMNKKYELIFVLDPSKDQSENIIISEIEKNSNIKLIVNSRRFGQPASMLAGLENSNGKNIVFIDVDLQDPPELIEEMYKFINSGYEAVLAQRTLKIKENILRNFISNIGYNIISKMSDTNIPK